MVVGVFGEKHCLVTGTQKEGGRSMERKEAIRSAYRLTGGIMTAFIH